MVVVDTSVLVDWDRGQSNAETNWLRNHLRAEEIGITDLILCEALRGCRDDAQARRLEGWLALFSHPAQRGACRRVITCCIGIMTMTPLRSALGSR